MEISTLDILIVDSGFWIFRSQNWNFDALFHEENDKIIRGNVFLLTSLILISHFRPSITPYTWYFKKNKPNSRKIKIDKVIKIYEIKGQNELKQIVYIRYSLNQINYIENKHFRLYFIYFSYFLYFDYNITSSL